MSDVVQRVKGCLFKSTCINIDENNILYRQHISNLPFLFGYNFKVLINKQVQQLLHCIACCILDFPSFVKIVCVH